MQFSRLFLFVEGNDDEKLLEHLKDHLFKNCFVQVVQCSQKKKDWIKKFVENFKDWSGADYIFFVDNDSVCVTVEKKKLLEKRQYLDPNKIIVVVKEIESWYLAGINETGAQELELSVPKNTDAVTKEKFDKLIPRKFQASRIDFLVEILKYFDLDLAQQRNTSFAYFLAKFGPSDL